VDAIVDDQAWFGEEVQVSDHDDLWTSASQALRDQVSEAVWFSTFQDAVSLPAESRVLRLGVPSAQVRDRIVNRYFSLLRLALDEMDADDVEVEVEVTAPTEHVPDPPRPAVPTLSDLGAHRFDSPSHAGLNPRYTFETFVKGTSNQFALAASQRVAEVPARSYNPLFIYGAAGLGKTHLLHAIGHYVLQNYAHYQVLYVSTETFLNEYVDGIRTNSIAGFKRRYREIDVLLIDDIQFMEGKEGLQEEFFHTFNSLHGANKQIIISSDRVPDAIPTLEDRLRGRFKWGLITDIQPPDMETRLAILRNKAEREGSPVASDVLEFIATHITSNIRELEGALIRVSAYASLNQVPVSVDKAQHLLADLLTENTPKVRTDQEMLEEIAGLLGYPVEQLCGKSRQRPLVTARQIAMYVFRQITDLSYPAIARLFGGRDHTTVIHAVDKIERLMKERKQIFDQVNDLTQRLKMA
jgi:chromosomal replication initiator protein